MDYSPRRLQAGFGPLGLSEDGTFYLQRLDSGLRGRYTLGPEGAKARVLGIDKETGKGVTIDRPMYPGELARFRADLQSHLLSRLDRDAQQPGCLATAALLPVAIALIPVPPLSRRFRSWNRERYASRKSAETALFERYLEEQRGRG